MFVDGIFHWIILTLNLKLCLFLATLHLLFSLLPHDLLLLLAEFQLFRRSIWASHAIAVIRHTISITWWSIRVIALVNIRTSREWWSHWVLSPRIILLRALGTFNRSLVLSSKDWFLCLSSHSKECNQSKLHY